MEPEIFNKECRYLRRDRMVRVWLADGHTIEGFPLDHVEATNCDGSLLLETNRGPLSLPSSSIKSIEPLSDLEA
jgi:hypothetical protein